MGVVTQSTKDMLLQLEDKKETLAIEIAKLSGCKPKVIDTNECADFLFSLTALDFSVATSKELLFNRFIRRVELGNKKIRIFFNPVDKPFLYNRKEEDLSPQGSGGNGNDPIENGNETLMQKCSSVDALSPPNDCNPNPIAINAEVFGFFFRLKTYKKMFLSKLDKTFTL